MGGEGVVGQGAVGGVRSARALHIWSALSVGDAPLISVRKFPTIEPGTGDWKALVLTRRSCFRIPERSAIALTGRPLNKRCVASASHWRLR